MREQMYYPLSFWKMHFLMGMVSGSFSNPSVHFCKLFTFMSRLTWRALFWMNIFVVSCAGKVINIRRLNEVINSINGWYMERGLFGSVSTEFSLSGFGFSSIFWFNFSLLDRFQMWRSFLVEFFVFRFLKLKSTIYLYASLTRKRENSL